MRWKGRRGSTRVIDRRMSGGRVVAGGGFGVLILALIVWILGGNPLAFLSSALPSGGTMSAPGSALPTEQEEELAQFVSVVLADTEDVWTRLFAEMGRTYREPSLVVFNGQVRSACGYASAATGPFYCPADQQAYIDLGFYRQLSERFGAPGDFAQAYVIAHEIGHHVQNLLGTMDQINAAQRGLPKDQANALSVRLELQADFYAGVWAHHAQSMHGILEPGDIEEALRAAAAIGDDRIQMQSQGYVVPDSFTHGSAAQRVRWFKRGLETGNLAMGRIEDIDP